MISDATVRCLAFGVCADRCAHVLHVIRLLDSFSEPCELRTISLDVSLRLSSHSLQALPRCDCLVSALCLPRSSFSGRFVLSSF